MAEQATPLDELLEFPLMAAIFGRRSRRFGMGMSILAKMNRDETILAVKSPARLSPRYLRTKSSSAKLGRVIAMVAQSPFALILATRLSSRALR
jgi:hypothetical protein